MNGIAPDVRNVGLSIAIRSPEDEHAVQSVYQAWQERSGLFGAHQSAPCGDDARHQAALGRKHAANRGNEILVEGSVRRACL
jgi:hypothetical protein